MKKAKITLYHKAKNGLGIYAKTRGFRNLLEDVTCVLLLSVEEYDDLKYYLSQHNGKKCGVTSALFDFTHLGCCTKAHKYKIWNTFDGISNIQYEWNKEF